MDTQSLYVSLNAALAAVVLLIGWVTIAALRASYPAAAPIGSGHPRHGEHPLTLAGLLWLIGLMLAFYRIGMYLGYLLLGVG